jgi:2'-hydroxyisoflavone reductase
MNVLIMGGTRFHGRELTKQLLALKSDVTVFHRGNYPIEIICPGVRSIIGDRNNPECLKKLRRQPYDWCIDTSAYTPDQVISLSKHINVLSYCLISSIFAYKDDRSSKPINENNELKVGAIEGLKLDKQSYPLLKAACERAAQSVFGLDTLIIRPSIVIGEHDHTERLKFWLRLVAVHLIAPSIDEFNPLCQPIDVIDSALFLTRILGSNKKGPVNVCGDLIHFKDIINTAVSLIGSTGSHVTVKQFLEFGFGMERLPFLEDCQNRIYDTSLACEWGLVKTPFKLTMDRMIQNKEYICSELTHLAPLEQLLVNALIGRHKNHV